MRRIEEQLGWRAELEKIMTTTKGTVSLIEANPENMELYRRGRELPEIAN
jgi:hypothetical protein